jgi:hypothetical protein
MRALMLMGMYAGQILMVDDTYAAQGVIDLWCRDTAGLKYPFNSTGIISNSQRSNLPASYIAWASAGYPASGGGLVANPNRWMLFGTRARPASGTLRTAAAGQNYHAAKLAFNGPKYPSKNLMFYFPNYSSPENATAPIDTQVPGNPLNIDGVSMVIGGTSYPLDFSGSPAAAIADGGGAWGSIALPMALGEEDSFFFIPKSHVAVGEKFVPVYRHQRHRGEKIWVATSLAALDALINADAPSTVAIDVEASYNQTTQFLCYGPTMMVSKGHNGGPVVLVYTDSMGAGRQELAVSAGLRGEMGLVARFFDRNDPGYGRVPFCIVGMPGAKADNELKTASRKRFDAIATITALNGGLPPFTCAFDQMDHNDNINVVATWIARSQGLVSRHKAEFPGIKIIKGTITGQATSTNNHIDLVNQTVAANFLAALDGLNAEIRANTGNWHDGYLDINATWQNSPTDKKWPPSLSMPAGISIVGHPGNQDGVTVWSTFITNAKLNEGWRYVFEISTGVYTRRMIWFSVDNGNGTWTNTVQPDNALATACMIENAPLYIHPTDDGTHGTAGFIVARQLSALQASEKAKFF